MASASVNLDNLLSKSRKGQSYIFAYEQYANMLKLLQGLSNSQIKKLEETFRDRTIELKAGDFKKIHTGYGGIVSCGDDGFYMDFAGWVIAQGSELLQEFKQRGHIAVIDYIGKHNVSRTDYLFESMIYVFDAAITEKYKKEKIEKWKQVSLDSTQLSFILGASIVGSRVCRLILAPTKQIVGYRIITSAPRGMSNTWCFDIDKDDLDTSRLQDLESNVRGNMALYPVDNLYLSSEEQQDGVLAVTLTDLKLIDQVLNRKRK